VTSLKSLNKYSLREYLFTLVKISMFTLLVSLCFCTFVILILEGVASSMGGINDIPNSSKRSSKLFHIHFHIFTLSFGQLGNILTIASKYQRTLGILSFFPRITWQCSWGIFVYSFPIDNFVEGIIYLLVLIPDFNYMEFKLRLIIPIGLHII
jgi:hypothetical protein